RLLPRALARVRDRAAGRDVDRASDRRGDHGRARAQAEDRMSAARALVVMTPLTDERLGAEREAIERGVVRLLPGSELVLADDARRLRALIGELEPEVIVAAGGDGTANLALQAMRDQDALAVLPLGTANDLAHFLGVSRNPEFVGSFVLQAARRIDLLRVNDQRFCTTGGLVLPAEVAHRVNTLRNDGCGAWLAGLGSKLYSVIGAECCVR